jgi:predicted nucleic acid-binding protein
MSTDRLARRGQPHLLGVYDCLYVALAERRKCRLVTADEKLVRHLQPHFSFIVVLSSLP